MPIVPLRSVRPTPEPSRVEVPRVAQIAGAVGATAQGLDAFARERDRLDDIRVQEAEVQYRTDIADLFQGENGLLAKRGTQAAEAWDGVTDGLRTKGAAAEATLSTDRQRTLFARRQEALSQDAAGRARLYVDGELRRTHAEQFNALNAMDVNRVSANPDVAETAIREADERVALYGQSNGTADAEATRQRQAMRSGLRTAQITTLADAGDIDAATEAFETHSADVQGADRQRVERALQDGNVKVKSAAEESRILTQHPTDKAAALAEARKIENVGVRDATVNRLMATFAQNEAMERDENSNVLGNVLVKLQNSRGNLSVITAQEREVLARSGQMDNVELRASQLQNGHPPVSQRKAMDELYAMDQATLAALDPNTYVARLSASDFGNLREWVQKAKNGDQDPAAIARATDRMLFDTARSLELFSERTPAALEGDNKDRWDTYRYLLREEMDIQEGVAKRRLTIPEIRAAVREVLDNARMESGDWRPTTAEDRPARFPARPPAGGAALRPTRPVPPMAAGATRRARWNQLRAANFTEDEATAQVIQEFP